MLCNCYVERLQAPLSPVVSGHSNSFVSTFDSSVSSMSGWSSESIKAKVHSVIRNFSTATSSICISERLPRFNEMIFINLTTIEGDTYCVELTKKGWRITSTDHDSMSGDFRKMHLFIVYYDSLTDLLRAVSPKFEEIFNDFQQLSPTSSSCCSTPRSTSP